MAGRPLDIVGWLLCDPTSLTPVAGLDPRDRCTCRLNYGDDDLKEVASSASTGQGCSTLSSDPDRGTIRA
jgi:hypothetical protein